MVQWRVWKQTSTSSWRRRSGFVSMKKKIRNRSPRRKMRTIIAWTGFWWLILDTNYPNRMTFVISHCLGNGGKRRGNRKLWARIYATLSNRYYFFVGRSVLWWSVNVIPFHSLDTKKNTKRSLSDNSHSKFAADPSLWLDCRGKAHPVERTKEKTEAETASLPRRITKVILTTRSLSTNTAQ